MISQSGNGALPSRYWCINPVCRSMDQTMIDEWPEIAIAETARDPASMRQSLGKGSCAFRVTTDSSDSEQ